MRLVQILNQHWSQLKLLEHLHCADLPAVASVCIMHVLAQCVDMQA